MDYRKIAVGLLVIVATYFIVSPLLGREKVVVNNCPRCPNTIPQIEKDSFSITPSAIFSKVQILNLKDGMLDIPEDTDYLMIEIGANNAEIMIETHLPKYEKGFLITFEPLLDKYSQLIARYSQKLITWSPLGFQHPRGIALPFAISDQDGEMAKFNLAPIDGCSSLLEHNKDATWAEWCSTINEVRYVPTISLETVLKMIPSKFDVNLMKVDAQGFDLHVIRSGKTELPRVRKIITETVADSCEPLYVGQLRCTGIIAALDELGFAPNFTECTWKGHCERDYEFTRKNEHH